MAVFMLNVCKFNDCGLTFKTLGRLIEHIEDTHIDFDPRVVEQTEQQQPPCIPLSYVLRFFNHTIKKDNTKTVQQISTNQSIYSNNTKNTSPGGQTQLLSNEVEEVEDCVSEIDDSNDSWTTSEEFSSDFILRYGSRTVNQNNQGNQTNGNALDKPFACPVPGCKKRYKNVNGIRYHSKNGHKNDGKIRKAFKCSCGKSYKTLYGLRNHTTVQHNGQHTKIMPPRPTPKTESKDCDFDDISRVSGKPCRLKVAAIEDHGYMKTEHLDIDCDLALGILTPASSPIKLDVASQSHAYTKYLGVQSSQTHRN